MAHFSGKVIIITGASSGIGRALALELAPQRARLVLAARDAGRLESVAADCRKLGAEALTVPTDVTVDAECRHLISKTVEHFGQLDVLVNNAGRAMWTRFDELPNLSVIEELFRLNFFGSLQCTRFALPHLKQSRGLIVAVASFSGLVGVPLLSGYAASKHAVIGFFESLRIELARSGVGVTIIAPDFVQSEVLERAMDAKGEALGMSPLDQRKLLTAEKCARRMVRAMQRRQRLLLTSERSNWARWGKILAPSLVDWFAARSAGSAVR